MGPFSLELICPEHGSYTFSHSWKAPSAWFIQNQNLHCPPAVKSCVYWTHPLSHGRLLCSSCKRQQSFLSRSCFLFLIGQCGSKQWFPPFEERPSFLLLFLRVFWALTGLLEKANSSSVCPSLLHEEELTTAVSDHPFPRQLREWNPRPDSCGLVTGPAEVEMF